MRRRAVKGAVATGVAVAIAESLGVLPAYAGYGTSYYYNAIADMDGVFAYSSIGNLTPANHMCIGLQTSFQASNGAGTTLALLGLYSCNGYAWDGTCGGGPKKDYEQHYGGSPTYTCTEEGAAATNTAYTMQTYRTGSLPNGTEVYSSYLAGVYVGQLGGFANISPEAWYGEEPYYDGSGFPCNSTWKGSGSWSTIEYRQRSTGQWKNVTAAPSSKTCVALTAFSSSGGFSAYHS